MGLLPGSLPQSTLPPLFSNHDRCCGEGHPEYETSHYCMFFSLHNPTLTGSLRLLREDLVVLFKPPTRSNIFLQVKPYLDISHYQSEIKVRDHSTPQDDDHEPLWSFLVPVIADESLQSVQIFFQKKLLLNAASMPRMISS